MKKTKLFAVLALTAGLLASCGGGEGTSEASPAGASVSASKSGSKATTSTSRFSAIWSEDSAQYVAPTCDSEGKKVEVCVNSSMSNKETAIPKKAHTWGTKSEKHTEEGKTGYWTNECSECHTKAIIIDALGYTKIEGSNKDTSGETLKLSSPNGSYVEYELTMPQALTNVTVGVYGWVDYWKDGSNNNDQRGFFSRKEGEGANVGVNINGNDLEITNHKTYEEMGMTAGDNGNGSFTLCEMGTVASIAQGAFKLTYTRLESYNLNITEIWLMYK